MNAFRYGWVFLMVLGCARSSVAATLEGTWISIGPTAVEMSVHRLDLPIRHLVVFGRDTIQGFETAGRNARFRDLAHFNRAPSTYQKVGSEHFVVTEMQNGRQVQAIYRYRLAGDHLTYCEQLGHRPSCLESPDEGSSFVRTYESPLVRSGPHAVPPLQVRIAVRSDGGPEQTLTLDRTILDRLLPNEFIDPIQPWQSHRAELDGISFLIKFVMVGEDPNDPSSYAFAYGIINSKGVMTTSPIETVEIGRPLTFSRDMGGKPTLFTATFELAP